ncbi:uncharacterized protein LOC144003506 [Festucalex cinctus]
MSAVEKWRRVVKRPFGTWMGLRFNHAIGNLLLDRRSWTNTQPPDSRLENTWMSLCLIDSKLLKDRCRILVARQFLNDDQFKTGSLPAQFKVQLLQGPEMLWHHLVDRSRRKPTLTACSNPASYTILVPLVEVKMAILTTRQENNYNRVELTMG